MLEPRKLRGLVVDDNEDSAFILARLLENWGYEARACFDGQAALELMTQWWPDVVVLDIGMPQMDGYEVARRIRQRAETPGLRPPPFLVALTGYGCEDAIQRTREAGFDGHLLKPLDRHRFRELLGSPPRRPPDI